MKYAIKEMKENMAATQLRGLPISLKDSIMIANFIKGKNVQKVKKYLGEVISLDRAIPYTRYNSDRGHKKGNMAAGRFPVKACKNFLIVIKSAESNAIAKGLNVDKLIIAAVIPNKGNVGYHFGRRRGLKTKSVHIQLYVEESTVKADKKVKKPAKKEEKVAEEKPKIEVKKEAPKKEEAKEKVAEPKAEEKVEDKTESPKEEAKVEAESKNDSVQSESDDKKTEALAEEKKEEVKEEVKND